jgi:hypothetical protein
MIIEIELAIIILILCMITHNQKAIGYQIIEVKHELKKKRTEA